MTLEQWAIALGILFGGIGAILGTAGFVISILVFLRDRPKVRIWVNWNMKVKGEGQYDPSRLYAVVNVTNVGRRPVFVSHVHFELPEKITKTKLVLFEGVAAGQRLEEGGEPAKFMLDQYRVQEKNPSFAQHWRQLRAVVIDSSGKHYRSKKPKPNDAPEFAPTKQGG